MNLTYNTLLNITKELNVESCRNWCQSELSRFVGVNDYEGFGLIILTIGLLLINNLKNEKLDKVRPLANLMAILLLIGFLIVRLWF